MKLKQGLIDILGMRIELILAPLGEDCGFSEPPQRRITIDPSLPYTTQVETFYHELVHTILALQGLDGFLDPKLEEALCQGLGVGLAYAVSANDLPYIFSKEEADE